MTDIRSFLLKTDQDMTEAFGKTATLKTSLPLSLTFERIDDEIGEINYLLADGSTEHWSVRLLFSRPEPDGRFTTRFEVVGEPWITNDG